MNSELNTALGSVDISEILNSSGSTISCVLLHAVAPKSESPVTSPSSVVDNTITSSTSTSAPRKTPDTYDETNESRNDSSFFKSDSYSDANIMTKDSQNVLNDQNTDLKKDPDTPDSNEESSSYTKPQNLTKLPQTNEPEYDLSHLVSQVDVDTTPKKRSVEKLLGGPITFLGQYEDLGIVVIALRCNNVDRDHSLSAGRTASENLIDDGNLPTLNPHKLQPPLHDLEVRGDILLMRVHPDEDNDVDDDQKMTKKDEKSEFFLDFTREEYLKFAARTDIIVPEDSDNEANDGNDIDNDQNDDFEDGEDENDDEEDIGGYDEEHDEDFEYQEDMEYFELDEEEEKVGMMNILMGQVLRKYREDNGRGPGTRVLLQMRQALAFKLGVDVPAIPEVDSDEEELQDEDDVNKDVDEKFGNENDTENIDECTETSVNSSTKNNGEKEQSLKRPAQDAYKEDTQNDITCKEKGGTEEFQRPKKRRVRWSIYAEDE